MEQETWAWMEPRYLSAEYRYFQQYGVWPLVWPKSEPGTTARLEMYVVWTSGETGE